MGVVAGRSGAPVDPPCGPRAAHCCCDAFRSVRDEMWLARANEPLLTGDLQRLRYAVGRGPTVRRGRVHQGHGPTAGLGVLFASQWTTQEAESVTALRPPFVTRADLTSNRTRSHGADTVRSWRRVTVPVAGGDRCHSRTGAFGLSRQILAAPLPESTNAVSFESDEFPILDLLLQFSDLLLRQQGLGRSGVLVNDLLETVECVQEVSGLLDAMGHTQALVGQRSGINDFSRTDLPHLRFLAPTSGSLSARCYLKSSLFEIDSPRLKPPARRDSCRRLFRFLTHLCGVQGCQKRPFSVPATFISAMKSSRQRLSPGVA